MYREYMDKIKGPAKMMFLAGILCIYGCTKHPVQDAGHTEIGFSAACTKAAIDNGAFSAGDAFAVYGYYSPIGNTSAQETEIFNAEKVSFDGNNWTYNGARYWIPGNEYDFYAIFPFDTKARQISVEPTDGETPRRITITGFDATHSIDLMTAANTGIACESQSGNGTVGLTFRHHLARLSFPCEIEAATAAANPSYEVRINEACIYGMTRQGDIDITGDTETWDFSNYGTTTGTSPFCAFSDAAGDKTISGTTVTDLFGDDILLFPSADLSEYRLHISFSTRNDASSEWKDETKDITFSSLTARWEASRHYRYTLTFQGNNILFTVNIADWNESMGGIITVE